MLFPQFDPRRDTQPRPLGVSDPYDWLPHATAIGYCDCSDAFFRGVLTGVLGALAIVSASLLAWVS